MESALEHATAFLATYEPTELPAQGQRGPRRPSQGAPTSRFASIITVENPSQGAPSQGAPGPVKAKAVSLNAAPRHVRWKGKPATKPAPVDRDAALSRAAAYLASVKAETAAAPLPALGQPSSSGTAARPGSPTRGPEASGGVGSSDEGSDSLAKLEAEFESRVAAPARARQGWRS